MGNRFVVAERLDRLGDLGQQEMQPLEREVDPDERRPREPRFSHRLSERQARHALCRDHEPAGAQRKFLVVRIKAEALLAGLLVAQGQQALAADVQAEAGLVDRPVRGNSARASNRTTPSRRGQVAPRAISRPSKVQPSSSRLARARQWASSPVRTVRR